MINASIIYNLRSSVGFSLSELMMTIAVTAVLAATAAPSFVSLILKNKVTTQANAVIESLNLARSYAISRQEMVNICHIQATGQNNCSNDFDYNSKWSFGWLVFVDHNANRAFDDADELIRIVQLPDTINIVFNQLGALRFHPDGSARSAGFYLCDKQQKHYKHIYLLHSGRARVNNILSTAQKKICDQI